MSKERYKTQDELTEVVRNFRKDGFPLDYIVQDWQYWGGRLDKSNDWRKAVWDDKWSGMIWDKERFPNPTALTKTLHDELHVKLMNSIWPSIGNGTELAHDLDAKGLRFPPLHWITKQARIYDAFSPRAARFISSTSRRACSMSAWTRSGWMAPRWRWTAPATIPERSRPTSRASARTRWATSRVI